MTVYLLGGSRPVAADLNRFMTGKASAWPSPLLFARLRNPLPARLKVPEAAAASAIAAHGRADGVAVLGLDGSPQARRAIQEAGRVLRPGSEVWSSRHGSRSTSASPRPKGCASTPTTSTPSGPPRSIPRPWARAWPKPPGSTARSEAVESSPIWRGVVQVADDHDASLIVSGSHSRRAEARGMVGSIAGDISTHTRRPVLLIRDAAHRPNELASV